MCYRKQNVHLNVCFPAACYYHIYKSQRGLYCSLCCQMSDLCTSKAPTPQTSRPQFLRATKLWTLPRGNKKSPHLNHAGFSSFSFGILTSLQPLHIRGPSVWLYERWGPEELCACYRRLPGFGELLPYCSVCMYLSLIWMYSKSLPAALNFNRDVRFKQELFTARRRFWKTMVEETLVWFIIQQGIKSPFLDIRCPQTKPYNLHWSHDREKLRLILNMLKCVVLY